ncbi:MAG: 4'-phosphopantetheinyl transferase superfamily protein [Oscillospiraceae bacterium]|nr:4'-phosphopantetheinyl transferase superfamily protein [Oscillospiraceae bacterium]
MSPSVVYYLDHIQTITESDVSELLPFLSQERRETMGRYRFPKDRIQSVLAYLLLRYGLIRDHGITQIPEILKTERGKPYFAENSEICFNLSHCETAVACGFSSRPIGVDVQQRVPYKASLAEYFMTADERNTAVLGNADLEFTRLWTVKESYGKYLGSGICYSMADTQLQEGASSDGYIIRSHCIGDGFLSVCAEEEIPVKKISFHQLRACFVGSVGSNIEREHI